MMNTKIYKAVHELAEKLMVAANKNDERAFGLFYEQLKTICVDNENTKKDHPVQWETLADFTDELEDAVPVYEKALAMAVAIKSDEFICSIAYSMASLQLKLNLKSQAIENLELAKKHSTELEDKELKAQIHDLLYPLTNG